MARTLAAEGGGKNVDLMFVVAEDKDGTCDPGFPAHVTPVKHLSLAVWQEWVDRELLIQALCAAWVKLYGATSNVWRRVTGPIGTLTATLWRIGWDVDGETLTLTYDLVHKFELRYIPTVV